MTIFEMVTLENDNINKVKKWIPLFSSEVNFWTFYFFFNTLLHPARWFLHFENYEFSLFQVSIFSFHWLSVGFFITTFVHFSIIFIAIYKRFNFITIFSPLKAPIVPPFCHFPKLSIMPPTGFRAATFKVCLCETSSTQLCSQHSRRCELLLLTNCQLKCQARLRQRWFKNWLKSLRLP